MEKPEISVIVPVYNVEPYLRRCLDSIAGQTCGSLEIILVDDGSPDRCGEICDEYAAQDKRIRVIHKPNGGLSSARNVGLAAASGTWIGWVDSDDWIETGMFADMLACADRNRADIVVCGRLEQSGQNETRHVWSQERLLDPEAALELLLRNDVMQCAVWDKLWRRELFDGISFPEGQNYEDLAVVHRLFCRAGKIACLPGAYYHYIQRADGILGDPSLGNRIGHYLAAKQRLAEMQEQWPQLRGLLEGQCAASAMTVWCGYYSNPKAEREKYRPQLRQIAAFAAQHYHSALENIRLGCIGRMVVRLVPYAAWWSFSLAWVLGQCYRLRHGRML
ncbi:MAG: glycosyltransferase family 2 protein [Clostridiaceae bacterium]|nr:glycosyltransferase family 2 protein [Clostridiaceae bacterium]